MEILELDDYIESHSTPEPAYLKEIVRQTHLTRLHPRMLSGQIQGRFLSMISRMIKPLYILELGTFTGYSALCLAEGLQENGKIITIEIDDEQEDFILNNFKSSPYADKIELITGDALKIIPTLKYTFDLVLIDAEKSEYPEYLQAVITLLNKNSFIIADNVLWDNKVLNPKNLSDPSTKGIMEFNKMITENCYKYLSQVPKD